MDGTLNFIHLRSHSSYSLLESIVSIKDLVAKASEEKMPAIALTDKGNLFGSLEFSMQASMNGVQPIAGCVFKFNPQLDASVNNHNHDDILIIAKNSTGYKNLLKLASEYYTKNQEDSPAISFEQLAMRAEGLIILTCGIYGTVGKLLLNNQINLAEEFLLKLNSVFKDHLYIELMRHGLDEEENTEDQFIDFALKHNIPLVATNNICFLDKDLYESHEVLLCISDNKYITEESRRRSSPQYYFKSAAEMIELFEDIPEAINNTIKIAKRCSVKCEERKIMFPKYHVSIGKTEEEELKILATQGLNKRLDFINTAEPKSSEDQLQREKEYHDRLNYELDIIIKMGFPGYFLIVSDFIRWAKSQGIPVGPGRGSGAGSVVSWSLDITDIDPIKYGLFFERFLNPERISPPDLDIDFCQDRRDEVINYVRNKYGKNKVAHIITFGKLQARAVLRDVGRVLQVPYMVVDKIAKMVPFNAVNPVTLAQAIEMEPELKKSQETDPQIERLLSISLKLEGVHRHASTHAAGVVIAAEDLEVLVPLYKDSKTDMPVIQYSMKYAEAAGLIKFDFLGLKTLTVISNCEKIIKETNPEFDIRKISLEDEKTFAMLAQGKSTGVFQFESVGMRSSLSKIKPDSIEDIIALGALYRPGPMDNIPTYIDCKHGKLQPNYLYPSLENTLKKTFGVIIYQEQVMEIARILAGYSLGEADLLRRAMGKKIKKEMDDQRKIFVTGAISNGISKEQASEIFDLVAKFAGYGFPKPHAVAYGVISYQTAYLKANYTIEIMVSILNSEIYDTNKINIFTQEAKNFNIKTLPPDINKSLEYFSISYENNERCIVYALGAIKNIGFDSMKLLREEREKNGLYKDIFDFMARSGQFINKRQLEYLIKAGAFDSISDNRRQLFDSLDTLVNYNSLSNKRKASSQLDLFAKSDELDVFSLENVPDWSSNIRLNHECSAIGFYLSDHPLEPYKNYFKATKVIDAAYMQEVESGTFKAKIAAIPVVIKNRSSPRGRYVITSMSTPTGMLDVTIFDDSILEANRDSIYSKMPLLINAEIRKDEGVERITALAIQKLDDYLAKQKTNVVISLKDSNVLNYIKKFLIKCEDKSSHSIIFRLSLDGKDIEIKLPTNYRFDILNDEQESISPEVLSIEHIC